MVSTMCVVVVMSGFQAKFPPHPSPTEQLYLVLMTSQNTHKTSHSCNSLLDYRVTELVEQIRG